MGWGVVYIPNKGIGLKLVLDGVRGLQTSSQMCNVGFEFEVNTDFKTSS